MNRPNKMTCEEVFNRLDDFVDRELSAEERQLVEEHLQSCAVCASEYRFEASLIEELRAKLERIQIPPRLRADIAARLKREGQGKGGSG